jgi:hydroxymethylglutaryl-CoA lyase
LSKLPERVEVHEVGLRDGLQSEAVILSSHEKVSLAVALMETGLKRIEATSFVSPSRVPQLADAETVMGRLPRRSGIELSALVPNLKGLERAEAAGVKSIAVLLSASETFGMRNTNVSIAGMLKILEELVPIAIAKGMRVRGYLSAVWGCPYEGAVDSDRSVHLAERLLELGCYEVSLGDTIGIGTPGQTRMLLERFLDRIAAESIGLHFHDTRGMALTNVAVGLDMGIRVFDSSIGGLGGCPYAPGASGNLATEDLVYMLNGLGVQTGTDLAKLCQVACLAETLVKHRLPGRVHSADSKRCAPAGPAGVTA